ncbi:MAG: hypothetical protein ACREVX_04760 [Clostridium sp.]|uniref:hypothetical protein n=1 Tax=Clostridium sp. TaxID=1506 RepID=UPI003D6D56A3
MNKKILAIIFLFIFSLHSTMVFAQEFKYVEIFDPKQEKVVKLVQLNEDINNMVTAWIKDVDDIYGKSNPITNDGYAIRVPLDPKVRVQGKCLNILVNDVYIIIPEKDMPFFIIFDDENKLLCYPFKGDIDVLSKILDFKLKSS